MLRVSLVNVIFSLGSPTPSLRGFKLNKGFPANVVLFSTCGTLAAWVGTGSGMSLSARLART